jgi:glutamate dehydrogenase/leucine dehydrogenase
VTLHTYRDARSGVTGFLAYEGTERPLAAGGLRVQPGLTADRIGALAVAMRVKQDLLGTHVNGAKCGIDLDPAAPGKQEALRGFLRFLAPHLGQRLSLGPDMGTGFAEIEALAQAEGIASVKGAIARAQGLPDAEVLRRLRLLDFPLGPLTLGERRAGHALAHAALAVARRARPQHARPTCALQGFGTLGRGAAATLAEAGARVVAVADEHTCLLSEELPIADLLARPAGTPLAEFGDERRVLRASRGAVLSIPADVLVLAACEDAIADGEVAELGAASVAVGANAGLTPAQDERLTERGVAVVPDCVAGAGGSAAMDALFAPAVSPDAATVLAQVGRIAGVLTARVLDAAAVAGVPPRTAALALAAAAHPLAGERPYGLRTLAPPLATANDRARAELR